ncbi:MAG: hypothetical protein ACD_78C00153G0005 [uncultured bacterium (gcode 4)]|uniref:Uncharacterized protein n=1 Tax=uncultured bacterium (gcode 4) TaxID=1234023 RepID=K1YXK9_9BACT|nr:MAG: hypothetical protein ACD_78C00153G0005 [uncultured bacterium (gcode 4)]
MVYEEIGSLNIIAQRFNLTGKLESISGEIVFHNSKLLSHSHARACWFFWIIFYQSASFQNIDIAGNSILTEDNNRIIARCYRKILQFYDHIIRAWVGKHIGIFKRNGLFSIDNPSVFYFASFVYE